MFRKEMSHTTTLVFIASLLGCGQGGGGDPAPPGSSVRINPSSIEWDISDRPALCAINQAVYHDHTIAISVLDANNSPVGNVDIRIVPDLAGNTYSGTPVIKLYDDLDQDGIIDDPNELVSSNTSPAYVTQTDRYTGSKTMLLRVNLSCPYRGNLYVYAGSAFNSINIQVNEIPPEPAP